MRTRKPLASASTTNPSALAAASSRTPPRTSTSAPRARRWRPQSLRSTDGRIGSCEYAYANQTKRPCALMATREGRFIGPDDARFKAAAAAADWAKAPGMYLILTDQAGRKSWPITGASFILIHRTQDKP